MQKVYLLVGLTGSGKSTTGNCVYNKSGQNEKIINSPFLTSDNASGCTLKFQFTGNEEVILLDTVGFGDPQMNQQDILGELKDALAHNNNKVDCVLFVVRKLRFTNEVVKFFEMVQEKVLKDKCKNNSILVVTDCDKGWINNQLENKHLKKALDNCNGLYYEFFLKFDKPDDDDEDRLKNIGKRQKAIDDLLAFLGRQSFEKIDLSHVQTAEFKAEWYEYIIPNLLKILDAYYRMFAEKSLFATSGEEMVTETISTVREMCKTM